MKILKHKRYIEEDVINGVSSIYGMANLQPRDIGESFELWVDELGSDRNTGHNNPRFKPKANGIQLDIMLKPNGKAEIIDTDSRKIRKFKYAKEAVNFIEKYQEPLLMHWYGKIGIRDLANILYLATNGKKSIDEAMEIVLNGGY